MSTYRKEIKDWGDVKSIAPEVLPDIHGLIDEKTIVEMQGSWKDLGGGSSLNTPYKKFKLMRGICPRCKKKRYFSLVKVFEKLKWQCMTCKACCEKEG